MFFECARWTQARFAGIGYRQITEHGQADDATG